MPMIGTLLSVLVDFEMAVAAPDLLTNDKKNHSEKHVAAWTNNEQGSAQLDSKCTYPVTPVREFSGRCRSGYHHGDNSLPSNT
jgi:hypothetical protein